MTLLLTEIHCVDDLSKSWILFAANRRISRRGRYDATRKKIFEIPYLRAGVGFFGLAEIPRTARNRVPMENWLTRFVMKHSDVESIGALVSRLVEALNQEVPADWRQREVSSFHLAAYNKDDLPEFWYVRNLDDEGRPVLKDYEAREDFLRRDAPDLFDSSKEAPGSAQPGHMVQTYRNGGIRAHVTAWERLGEAFGALLGFPDFNKLRTPTDYAAWVKFKMESVAYFYKHYCSVSLIGRPIDTLLIAPEATR